MKKLPSDPDYLPKQEIAKMEWAIKFAVALALLGSKYNIAKELVDLVTANSVVITAFLDNFKKSKAFVTGLLSNKAGLLLVNPPDPNPLIDLTALPNFSEWPSASTPSTLLNAFIEAAELLTANVKLTAADRTALGLDKLAAVPSKRPTAEEFNYPMLSYTVENNVVSLRIKRGNRYKGMVCQVVMAIGDGGKFTQLSMTAKQVVEVPVIIPEGKLAATLVFQAAYMNGNVTASDWSPLLVVAVGKANEPEVAKAA